MGLIKVTLIGMLAYDSHILDYDMNTKTGLYLPTWHYIEQYILNPPVDNMQLLNVLCDRTAIIDNIIERCGDLPLLYADPEFFRAALYPWSISNLYKWASIASTCVYEYDALENYNRHTDISRTGNGSSSGTNTHSETAFNTGEYAGKAKDTSNGTSSDSEAVEETVRGNIGIRSSQELIMQQREIASFNYFDVIARDFCDRWCIELY